MVNGFLIFYLIGCLFNLVTLIIDIRRNPEWFKHEFYYGYPFYLIIIAILFIIAISWLKVLIMLISNTDEVI